MYSGAIAILSRIKWWLFGPKRKYCKSCCLTCQWYNYCRKDVEEFNTVYAEVYGENGWE